MKFPNIKYNGENVIRKNYPQQKAKFAIYLVHYIKVLFTYISLTIKL